MKDRLKKFLDNFISNELESSNEGRYGDAIASLFHNYDIYSNYFDVFNYELYSILRNLEEINIVRTARDYRIVIEDTEKYLTLLFFTKDSKVNSEGNEISYVCNFEVGDTLKLIDIEEVDENTSPTYNYLPALNNNL